ncbi:histidine phosphatase superfamily, partial [Phakopsora pachyrhizi]
MFQPVIRLPKVYCIRHGQTEWSMNGRHTGSTDLDLTEEGEKLTVESSSKLVGRGKILDRDLISNVLISPRRRARRTFELLFKTDLNSSNNDSLKVEVSEDVREWTYGDYEGLLKHEVAEMRKKKGLKSGRAGWDIWVDGCEGGESVEDLTARVDLVVEKVKKLHRDWVNDENRKVDDRGGDVLIVTHGHFSRCFIARWLGLPLNQGSLFSVDTGSVTVGKYYHDLDFPILGGLNILG